MSSHETPKSHAGHFEQEERKRFEHRRVRDAKVRQALDLIVESLKDGAVTAILGALAVLATDEDARQALEMVVWAIDALVYEDPQARAAVREWYARQRGCDPSRRSISIVKLNEVVESAVYVIERGNSELFPTKGVILDQLAEHIKSTFGPTASGARTPTAAELGQLISKRGHNRRRKQVTTAGITAAIVHQGRLFGMPTQSLAKTRNRVDSALRRKRKAERALQDREPHR